MGDYFEVVLLADKKGLCMQCTTRKNQREIIAGKFVELNAHPLSLRLRIA